ncbi:hypothetical protein J4433_03065 [Candidatus Pacearchaeota archaeon]|nr:hypothetical protein [Candidatus Pacearchaeota archaeon]
MAAKKIVEIRIPLIEETIEVEGTAEQLEGRTIRLDLTRILNGKSIEGVFVINAKELIAYPRKLTLLNFYIRRVIRKGTDYIEDSFACKSKDALLRIKPFMIARRKVSRKIRKALRDKAKEIIISSCQDKSAEEIFSEVLSARIQKELASKLKKIYPLAVCEIRVIEKEKQ